MPKNISDSQISKICSLYKATNLSYAEIAKLSGIGISSVAKYIQINFPDSATRRERGNSINKEKNSGRVTVSKEKIDKAVELMRTTDLTVTQIEKQLHMTGKTMRKFVYPILGAEFVRNRYEKLRDNFFERNSGAANALFKSGTIITCDNKGFKYRAMLKPSWYTGRGFTKDCYVREHILVVCSSLGISEIPKGFVVHHCDGNTLNNVFENLVLLPNGLHTSMHIHLIRKSATTISKESTLKWLAEARGFTWKNWAEDNPCLVKYIVDDDMVCSA